MPNGYINFKKLIPTAQIPHRQTPGAAGFDLHTTEDVVVPVGSRTMVPTGIAVALPAGTVGIIKDRSSEAWKHGITTMAGVIDDDYRGEIKVILHNLGEQPRYYKAGDRIAQLVVTIYLPAAGEVKELPDSERGEGGFGSTND